METTRKNGTMIVIVFLGFLLKYIIAADNETSPANPYGIWLSTFSVPNKKAAIEICEAKGMKLLIIDSKEKSDAFSKYAPSVKWGPFYISIGKETIKSPWLLPDGRKATYFNWAPKEPTKGSGELCIQASYRGDPINSEVWWDTGCYQKSFVACEPDPTKTTPAPPPDPTGAPDNPYGIRLSEYGVPNIAAAIHDCARIGKQLLVIDSQEKSDDFSRRVKEAPIKWSKYYLGIQRKNLKSNWYLSDGRVATFFNWGPNEPNNYNNKELCIQAFYKYGNYNSAVWNDVACNQLTFVACEPNSTASISSNPAESTAISDTSTTTVTSTVPTESESSTIIDSSTTALANSEYHTTKKTTAIADVETNTNLESSTEPESELKPSTESSAVTESTSSTEVSEISNSESDVTSSVSANSQTSPESSVLSGAESDTTSMSPVNAESESKPSIGPNSISGVTTAISNSGSETTTDSSALANSNSQTITGSSVSSGAETNTTSMSPVNSEAESEPSIAFKAGSNSTSGANSESPAISNVGSEMTTGSSALANSNSQIISGSSLLSGSESDTTSISPVNSEAESEPGIASMAGSISTSTELSAISNSGSETTTDSSALANSNSQIISGSSLLSGSESDTTSISPVSSEAESEPGIASMAGSNSTSTELSAISNEGSETTTDSSALANSNFQTITESNVSSGAESDTTSNSSANADLESKPNIESSAGAGLTSGTSSEIPEFFNSESGSTTKYTTVAETEFGKGSISPAVTNPKLVTKYNLYFSSDPVTYGDAQATCEEMNMKMITIEDKEKNDEIQKYLQQIGDTKNKYLTGAVRRGLDGKKIANGPFRWENLHRLTFRNFMEGTPRNYPDLEKTVIAVTNDGKELKWLDVKPSNKYYYICETSYHSDVSAPPEPDNPYNFHFSDSIVNSHKAAVSECAKLGMKLIRISNKTKNDALAKILEANDDSTWYLQQSYWKNNVLMWPNCESVKWTNPATDCSTNPTGLCESIHFDYTTQNVGWCRDDCSNQRFVLCEKSTKSQCKQRVVSGGLSFGVQGNVALRPNGRALQWL